MELPFGGTDASDTFETGTRAAAWGGTTTIVDFAVQRTGERVQDGLAAWHAKAGGQLRDRLRLPPDHRRRRRRLAQGDGRADRRGHHELQAVHGLPGRVLLRRRPDPAGDADGRRQRRDDHDARRERHRPSTCSSQQALARGETDPYYHGLDPAVADRGGGHPPRDHARRHHRRAAVRRARVGQAGRRAARRGPRRRARTCSARPARSTSTCRSRSSSARAGASRAPSGSARRRCAREAEGHQDDCGSPCAPNDLQMVSHRPLPVLHEGARRSWASATSPRSPTGSARSSTGWTCCTRASSTGGSRWSAGSSCARTTPARMFGLYGQKGVIAPGCRRRHRRLRPERAHQSSASARPTT